MTDQQTDEQEEFQTRSMLEWALLPFLTATRASAEGDSAAEELQTALITSLEARAEEARKSAQPGAADDPEGAAALWTAAAALCRAVLVEHRPALDLVKLSEELDKHPTAPWKVLCAMCYLGGSTDKKAWPLLAINLQLGVAEYVCYMTNQLPETYESVVVPWFCSFWERTFENTRASFLGPRRVETELKEALCSAPRVRVQRVLSTIAFGLGATLPEQEREWFLQKE